ncbi:UDP-4-amino-4,6-dideoxy-N-acetyl-beta-L-altrosamine N-acetyltransferase [Kurthia sibirica]|uniref:UDP-4-amino-4, 6-dideoxy-N-acetyl-beta-L-altrosamine N-acetyltransferase n=1 Tax=Kurthia sibirica TaxID=202750 RepID=A0A2U3AMN6_9BACL|nr:UDP-4-amino-4,6-dideoxy-N-acetyl-beta-L-altrosamine N-acetyltransferase [Kurthia sibirica]PWI25803.1 UDP-4-amino-4,6-dideoxy-N-acetyl-beta-L-altrosamine N-acetyltransferase [Kurthia sibirica]GEK33621.1 hypothetical protein KSI01_11540 [Kurthia sibirica]
MLNINKCSMELINTSTKDLVLEWRNSERIRTMMLNQKLIEKEQHEQWFNSLFLNKNILVYIFKYNNEPMGVVTFTKLNYSGDVWEWGFYIGESEAPKGMGTLLGYTAIELLFYELKKDKVVAEVLHYNLISLSFHEKLGFQKEGILRKQVYCNSQYEDLHMFGLFEYEWREKREKILSTLGAVGN